VADVASDGLPALAFSAFHIASIGAINRGTSAFAAPN